jgi:hypothetical protein
MQKIKKDYADLKNLLQQGGNASAKAAALITAFLNPTAAPAALRQ